MSDGSDTPAFGTGPEAWREAEALARRVLDPAGNVGGRVRFNLAPPLVGDLARRIAAEAAALAAGNARLRAERDAARADLDRLAGRLACNADPHYPLLFTGWVNGKPQYRALSSSEDAPAELRLALEGGAAP